MNPKPAVFPAFLCLILAIAAGAGCSRQANTPKATTAATRSTAAAPIVAATRTAPEQTTAARARAAASAAFAAMLSDPNLTGTQRQGLRSVANLVSLMRKHHGNFGAVYRELDQRYENGDASAAMQISFLYFVPGFPWHDEDQALAWAKRAANAGVKPAVAMVASLERSRFVSGDKAAGKEWLRWVTRGANDGDWKQRIALAKTYTNGHLRGFDGKDFAIPDLKPDPQKVTYWFEQAAQAAPIGVVDDIADRFQNGDGVSQHIGEAIKLYQREGDAGGAHNLGYNNAAWLLATCPSAPENEKHEAVALAQKGVAAAKSDAKATNDEIATSLDTLGAAYASEGDFDQAMTTQNEAIRIVTQASPGSQLAADLEKHLASYQASRPWVMGNECRDNNP